MNRFFETVKRTQIRGLFFLLIGFATMLLTSCNNATQEPPSQTGAIASQDVKTGETQWIDPAKIQRGPIRRDSLTEKQMERISTLQKIFMEVDGQTVEQWVDNFKRDLNPDNEIAIWERMANAYTKYCENRELSLEAKKDVYKVVLLRSMASADDVLSRLELTTISKQDAREVMANY